MYIFKVNSENASSKIVNLLMSRGINPLDIVFLHRPSLIIARNKSRISIDNFENISIQENVIYCVYDMNNHSNYKSIQKPLIDAINSKFLFDKEIEKMRLGMLKLFIKIFPDILVEYSSKFIIYCFALRNNAGGLSSFYFKGMKTHSELNIHLVSDFYGASVDIAKISVAEKYRKYLSFQSVVYHFRKMNLENGFDKNKFNSSSDFDSISSIQRKNVGYAVKAYINLVSREIEENSLKSSARNYITKLYAHRITSFKPATLCKLFFAKTTCYMLNKNGEKSYIYYNLISRLKSIDDNAPIRSDSELKFVNGYKAKPVFCKIKNIQYMKNKIIDSLNLKFTETNRAKQKNSKNSAPVSKTIRMNFDYKKIHLEKIGLNIYIPKDAADDKTINRTTERFMNDGYLTSLIKRYKAVYMVDYVDIFCTLEGRRLIYIAKKNKMFSYKMNGVKTVNNTSVNVTETTVTVYGE